jgi:replicative DNA helicase
MPDLFEKGAREGEMEIEAMKKLYEAMFKSLLDVYKGAQPGLQIEKKLPLEIERKKRGVAKEPQPQEQEAAVDDALTVDKTEKAKKEQQQAVNDDALTVDETEQQKKEQQQAVDNDFIIDKTEKAKKEQQPEPYGRVFGPGVNKLTESDCKTLAAIMSAKKGAIIAGSDYDYVVKYNGKVLFETTMGEITTHKKLPPELYNKIAALSPDPKLFDKFRDKVTDAVDWLKPETDDWGNSEKDRSSNPAAEQKVAGISSGINPPAPSNIPAPSIKKEAPHPLAAQRVAEISNAINAPEVDNIKARSVEEIKEPQLLSKDSPTIEEDDYDPDDFFQDVEGVDQESLEHIDAEPIIINETPEVEKPKLATKDQEVAINPVPEPVPGESITSNTVINSSPPEPASKSPHIDQLVSLMKDRANADMAIVKNSASQAKGIMQHYMGMVRNIPAGIIHNDDIDKSFEAVKGMFEEIARDTENELNQEIASPAVEDAPDPNLDKVVALFKVFHSNAGADQTTEKGREGTITFPAGEQLVNKIQDRQMFLSLVKDGTSWELGSYDDNTKDLKVGADMAAAQASLNQISQQLDEKWLIKQPSVKLTKPVANDKAPTTEKPVLKQEIATADPNSFYNFEAQENLIGKILLEPTAFQKSLDAGVSEKSFTPGLHRDIFLAARAITDVGKQVNGETIAKVMDSTQPNIRTDLATILARNAPGTSVDSIAEVVREKQIRRDMDRMAADLAKAAHDKTQPVFQTLRSNQNHATSIADGSYTISQQPPSLKNNFAPDNLKNVGSERLIIAAILNTAHPIKDLAITGLTSKAFTDPDHQEIFRAAETLHEKGLENNLMTIRNQVGDRAAVKASEIANNVTPQMVKEPIANVMGLAQRRDLTSIADNLATSAAQPGASKAELLEVLGKAKEDIKSVSDRSPKLPELEVTTTVENTVEKSNNISRGR